MLRLPLASLQSITSIGTILDYALPDTKDMFKFLGALLVHEENKGTIHYVIDLYNFIIVGAHPVGFHKRYWITYFDIEFIILEDDNITKEHVICISNLLGHCKPIPFGSKTWSSEDNQLDYEIYIDTLGQCYELYTALNKVYHFQNNELVLNLVTLFNGNYDTDLLTNPLGSTLNEIHNVINLLEENYPSYTLT